MADHPRRRFYTEDVDAYLNRLLDRLLAEQQAVLSRAMLGLYLHGSLALGAFNPFRSDIDFVVATDGRLAGETQAALAAMHARLRAEGIPWADHLEGSYIPVAALRRYDPDDADFPALRVDGSFAVDIHGSDWIIQRWVLREKGVALFGPSPATLIDPVSADALRRAAAGILREWWQPMLSEHYRLHEREYQAYAVLTMCRSLYTLTTGAIAAKSTAAQWALENIAPRWHASIERALAYPYGEQPDAFDETLALIAYTVAAGQNAGQNASP